MRRFVIAAVLTLLVDQISKYVVVFGLNLHQRLALDVIPPFLNFRMAWNRGVNFGLFSHDADIMRWVLAGIAVLIVAGLTIWAARGQHRPVVMISAGILAGGALGNAIDRALLGAVADFLNMSCCGITNPFSFNIADVAIFAGAAGVVLFSGRDKTP